MLFHFSFIRRFWMIQLGVFLFFFSFLKLSFALEALKERTSTKALGMGNAYSSIVENEDAFFYNPARIAKFRKVRWNILSGNFGFSDSIFSQINQMGDLNSKEKFAEVVNHFYSRSFEGHAGLRMSLEIPHFMLMASADGVFNFVPMDPTFPIFDVDMYMDITYGIGFGFALSPQANVGAVVKKVRREGIKEKIGPEWLATLDPDFIIEKVRKTGYAYIIDLGSSFNFDFYSSPVFSVVWKNPFKTKFKAEKEKRIAPPQGYESELIMGMGFTFNFGVFNLKPALDVKHILKTDLQWVKKAHLGVQFEAPFITLRTGLNQGYLTAGATVSLLFGLVEFDGAYYSQELGEYAGQFRENRMDFNLKLSVSTKKLQSNSFKKGRQKFVSGIKKIWRKLKKRRY